MEGGNPDAIRQADEKPVQKIFSRAIACDQVGANDKNDNPEKWFQAGWYPQNGRNGHCQSEQRKLEDQFPVHKIILMVNNRK